MTDIPGTAEQLTTGWLTATMRQAGVIAAHVEVSSFRVETLSSAGVGLSGDTARVVLEYGETSASPRSIIAKFPTAVAANRGMVESLDCYAREIAFYRDLAGDVPLRIPAHLGSGMDPGSSGRAADLGSRIVELLPARVHLAITRDITKFMRPSKRRYALLLEDMGTEGVVHDLADPPSVEQVHEALMSLARLHGAYWAQQHLDDHPAMKRLVTDIPRTYTNVHKGRARPMAEERWAGWLTDAHRSMMDAAVANFATDVDVVNEPMTLVHGDPRSDNLLYRPDGVVVLDWALTAIAHPGYDVAYLLGSSVRVDEMVAVPGLVDDYLAHANAAGAPISFAELRRGMVAGTRANIVQQVSSLPFLEGDYGEHGLPADLWTPRLFAFLEAL